MGSPLSDEDWRLVSIGVANGGVGARSALEHAPAAYISSLALSQELCARIWSGFDEYDIDGGLRRSEAEFDLISGSNASIHGSSNTPSQKRSLFSGTPLPGPLLPQSHSWSRAWLSALPGSLESHRAGSQAASRRGAKLRHIALASKVLGCGQCLWDRSKLSSFRALQYVTSIYR